MSKTIQVITARDGEAYRRLEALSQDGALSVVRIPRVEPIEYTFANRVSYPSRYQTKIEEWERCWVKIEGIEEPIRAWQRRA